MLVQPIMSIPKTNRINFKQVDWSAYDNHNGAPIPEIEQQKYHKTKIAESLEKLGKYAEAADEWFSIADICRQQGKERDAFLCETTARQLLKRCRL